MNRIGIVSQDQPENRFGIQKNYIEFASDFGHPVLILPIDAREFSNVYKLDAVILPGGSDVNSVRYGEKPWYRNYPPNPYQEYFDLNILPMIVEMAIPIFGICRGLQTLNVHFGGSLFQDLARHPYSTYDTQEVHAVYKKDSDKKKAEFRVNSFHHQGIKLLAHNFNAELVSDDGIYEAISDFRHRIFAVQWHPERLGDEYSTRMFEKILK